MVLTVILLTYMSAKLTSNPMNSSPFKTNNLFFGQDMTHFVETEGSLLCPQKHAS